MHNQSTKKLSRRHFLGTTVAATAASAILPVSSWGGSAPAILRRNAGGAKIGAISYSFRALPSSAEEILEYLVKMGMNTVELMGGPAEQFAGGPTPPSWSNVSAQMADDARAAFMERRKAYNEEASKWRLKADMSRFETLRKMYNDAGVEIDILKLGDARWSDAEIDYAFRAAKAVGARGISFEISDEAAQRMGPFATKHGMYVGMHNHTQIAEPGFSFDKPLSYSDYNMLNLDIGHFVAGLSTSPVPFIKKYHERITHLHIKDRKNAINGGANLPWGEGDTPIAEVLRLLWKEQYPITAMIELEYDIPEDSDVLTEMAKCVGFCRGTLA